MDDASGSAHKSSHFWINHNRQPLDLESKPYVAAHIDLEASSQPKRKAGEGRVASTINVSSSNAADHIGSDPQGPVVHDEFVRAIEMNLMKNYFRGGQATVGKMDVAGLPCP